MTVLLSRLPVPARTPSSRSRQAAVVLAVASTLGMNAAWALETQANRSWQRQPVAQSYDTQGTPRITGFDVAAVNRIEPGQELQFRLWGTPGAQATLEIAGAARVLALVETSPGTYEGTYVVSSRDRIAPDARVTANLRRDNRVGTALLGEPLQAGWQSPVAAVNTTRIERFTAEPVQDRNSGATRLEFRLQGTPGGRAFVRVPSSDARRVTLDEVRPGDYRGQYVVNAYDRFDGNQPIQARLHVGDNIVTAQADTRLDGRNLPVRQQLACTDCGVVTAINPVQVDGDGRVIGTVAGGVLGAVVGNQVGKGDGRKAATVAGAIGGALLGREIERRNRGSGTTQYEVVVRMDSGEQRVVRYEQQPNWRVGDNVRLAQGSLEAVTR